MSRRWEDTFPVDEDGVFPPCEYVEPGWDEPCADPVAVDSSGFTYAHCPAHLLTVSEPRRTA